MAWTQADLDALDAAIALGTKTIQYADKLVTYPSISEMLMARKAISDALSGPNATGGRTTLVTFDRG